MNNFSTFKLILINNVTNNLKLCQPNHLLNQQLKLIRQSKPNKIVIKWKIKKREM